MSAASQEGRRPAGRMVELTVEQCLRRLGETELGRITVNDERGPMVFPVNYVLDRGMVVFRTAPGTKLEAAVSGGPATFEIDDMEPRQRTGWSVIVRGRLTEVTDEDELEIVRDLPLHPMAGGDRDHFVTLHPAQITGYRIEVPARLSRDPDAAPDVGNVWSGADGDDLLG